jgi:hypothetical protein
MQERDTKSKKKDSPLKNKRIAASSRKKRYNTKYDVLEHIVT